jgi:cysteine synthase A
MSKPPTTILDTIGNTPLLALRSVVPANGARILLKLESQNPTGSMKDRMALAMIEAPEADGRLMAGGAVVEYTGGSTGVSLALICAVKKHPLHLVSSDAFSKEKLDHMRLLGAHLTLVPSENGKQTEKLTKDRGISETLRQRDDRIRIVAVEPAESAVLSGGPSGAHKIDGIGAGYIVPLWHGGIADRIERVSTAEARAMAFRLAAEEGLFCGTSTGANVTAALRLAESLKPKATVVTLLCDTGMKYLKAFSQAL